MPGGTGLFGVDPQRPQGGPRSPVDDLLDMLNQNSNQGATGGGGPGGQQWGTNVFGQDRNRSGPQQFDPQGNPINTPGIFQGGTSNRRAGLPQQGIVGSPNLGMASEINRLISQGVITREQAAQMGVLPQISQFSTSSSSSPAAMHAALNPGGSSAVGYGAGAASSPFGVNARGGLSSGSGGTGLDRTVPGALPPGVGMGAPGGGAGGGMPGAPGGQTPYSREQSPFEQSLQNAISGNLTDQTAQRRRMQTQMGESISGATANNLDRTREDAVRRGATGAQGDADIRDQMNRVVAQGGADQARGRNEIEQILQQFKSQAIGQGTGLLGEQMGDTRSIREMITMLEALKQQNSPVSGLQFSLGGR